MQQADKTVGLCSTIIKILRFRLALSLLLRGMQFTNLFFEESARTQHESEDDLAEWSGSVINLFMNSELRVVTHHVLCLT